MDEIQRSFKKYDKMLATERAPGQRSIFSPRTPAHSEASRSSNTKGGAASAPAGGEGEETEERILSIFFTANNLGAAVYTRETAKLELLKDIPDDPDSFEMLKALVLQVNADFVLVSARHDDRLIDCVKSCYQQDSATSTEDQLPPQILLRPGMDFGVTSSERRVKQIRMPGEPPRNQQEQNLQVAARVDFSCICMIRAAGALLKYMDKNFVTGLENDEQDILFINYLKLEQILNIDFPSLEGLQVFKSVNTQSASTAGSWNKTREGLSMYTILNRCNSVVGSRFLKRFLKAPFGDLAIIEERQNDVEFFTRAAHSQFVINLCRSIKKIKNFHRLIKNLYYSQISVADWLGVYRTLTGITEIAELADHCPGDVLLLKAVRVQITDVVFNLRAVMESIVDWPASQKDGNLKVKAGVDDHLDEIRRFHRGLPDMLRLVAEEEICNVPSFVEDMSVIYLPHVGFLICFYYDDLLERKGVDYRHLEDLDFMFENDDMMYYRNDRTRQLDRELGDVVLEIIKIETAIFLRLAESILNNRYQLEQVVTTIGQLDCMMSLALVGRDLNWVRPRMIRSGDIKIKKGRHPLQELTLPHHFIGNDTAMGRTGGKTHLLTGPNSSGKSIYLKQVGLIVYLAHLGCFVPAKEAEIPVVDQIFTRIVTYDAVSLGISAFFCDLQQLSFALNNFTPRSLCLVDEFGKGTLPEDGATLLAAAIEHVADLNQRAPYGIYSTHFHEIPGLIGRPPGVTFYHMAANKTDEGIVYLYKLEPGICLYSYASEVARAAYVKKHVIERMEEITVTRDFDLKKKVKKKRLLCGLFSCLFDLDLEDHIELYIFMQQIRKLKI